MFEPAIFTGSIRHQRFVPIAHQFTYRTLQVLLDTESIEQSCACLPHIQYEAWGLTSFYRQDYLNIMGQSLYHSLQDLYQKKTGKQHQGKIFLLTQLRHMNFVFNPMSSYFLVDRVDTQQKLVGMILEVHNTPWGEKHWYVLDNLVQTQTGVYKTQFNKAMHVSPFLTMDYQYHLTVRIASDKLTLRLANYKNNQLDFSAIITGELQSWAPKPWRRALRRNPLTTYKAVMAIYWQALKLWFKRVPYIPYDLTKKQGPWS